MFCLEQLRSRSIVFHEEKRMNASRIEDGAKCCPNGRFVGTPGGHTHANFRSVSSQLTLQRSYLAIDQSSLFMIYERYRERYRDTKPMNPAEFISRIILETIPTDSRVRDSSSAKSLDYQRRRGVTPPISLGGPTERSPIYVRESSDLVTGMGTCTMVEIARWRMEGTG